MRVYVDWDGRSETAEASITGFLDRVQASPEFTEMVRDFLHVVVALHLNRIFRTFGAGLSCG
jgi:hypothetical protein